MRKRKPESLALVVALVGMLMVLNVFLIDLFLSRQRDIDAGDRRLQHFGIMMAEHTARAFEAVDVLLREMSADLTQNQRHWENWEPGKGWEYVAQRHSRSMPQLRDLIIFDRYGNQRFISTYFPPPRINVKDRPYFEKLEAGLESSSFGPYVGRNSGRYSYALARRILGPDGRFAGASFAALEPAYMQEFCWANRLSDDFEAVLINTRNQIVASCRPTDVSRQSPILGAQAQDVLFGGRLRDILPETGLASGNDLRVSVSPVPGFADLRILAAIPEDTLLATWRNRLFELGTLGLLVTAVLGVGGLLIRRQVREMATMTEALTDSHETLETRIREATREIESQKEAAERANTAKSRFLAAASHDLRQPLHALSLFSADMQRQLRARLPGQGDLTHLAEQIATSASTLGELLDSLLDISRLDVAGIRPDVRAFPLAPLFERVGAAFKRNAADKQIVLRVRPCRAWVQSDPVMIERIIGNLVSNAVRYTPSGGRILLAARFRGEQLQIEIRDNGPGIAPEHQAAIFTEFYQVGNAAREQNKGLGLGLSIVDRLSRALGLKIGINSRLGAGTTFSLRLPRTAAVATPPAAPVASGAGNVLVVGTSDNLLSAMKLLENWQYTVRITPQIPAELPVDGTVYVTEQEMATALAERLPEGAALIVLARDAGTTLPPTASALQVPVRPAKLRALISQLQKVSLKSMP